ncbi:hypothetical protein HWV62_37687 [Athelia sp. TMB]|nr:hypothetical protein HWV62_37687 [Athelia sp. TMB]
MSRRISQNSSQTHRPLWEKLFPNNLPNPVTHTKEWISETDKICKDRFDLSKPLPYDMEREQEEDYFIPLTNENVLQEMVAFRRFACTSHHKLSRNVTMLLADYDFETKWTALSNAQREKHLLTAFKEQEGPGSAGLTLRGPQKLNCPELCWGELVKNRGQGFLDLLMRFMLDNNDKPPIQPLILEQPRYDEIIGWNEQCGPAQKAWLDFHRVMRTDHIGTYCSLVIAEYAGKKVEFKTFVHEHSTTKPTLAGFEPMVNLFMNGDETKTKRWIKDEAAQRKNMKLFCENCYKEEDKSQGKMSVCPPYVTSVFQDSIPVYTPEQLTAREDIPPPVPGYRRSAHLLKQISILNRFPDKDYIALTDEDEFGITLDELQGATVFNIMRNRCMASGDESALFYVYRVMDRQVSKIQLLQRQLRREYGTSFENIMKALDSGHPPAAPEVSTEEIDKMLVLFQRKGRFSAELQNYNPGLQGKKTQPMACQVGPKKDLTVFLSWPEDTVTSSITVLPLGKESWINSRYTKPQTPDILGPNHSSQIPEPSDGLCLPALEKQLHLLYTHPTADYVLWGQIDDPRVPYLVHFEDFSQCIAFLGYRRRLLWNGAEADPDSLAYMLMVLEPALLRKKIPMDAVRAQFEREYGEDEVRAVIKCITGEVYRRERDGKTFTLDHIPANRQDMQVILKALKTAGRFHDLLKNWVPQE